MYNDILDLGEQEIELEWDEVKRESNLQKHGLDFEGAYEIFDHRIHIRIDDHLDYHENRYVLLGQMEARIVSLVCTTRSDRLRIISLRKVNENEKKAYWSKI